MELIFSHKNLGNLSCLVAVVLLPGHDDDGEAPGEAGDRQEEGRGGPQVRRRLRRGVGARAGADGDDAVGEGGGAEGLRHQRGVQLELLKVPPNVPGLEHAEQQRSGDAT